MRRSDGDRSRVGDGIDRVHHKIDDDLIELTRIELHALDSGIKIQHQDDACRHQTPEQRMNGAKRVVQVHQARPQHLTAAEREQLLDQRGSAIGRPHQFFQRVVAVDDRRPVLDLEKVGANDDHRQQIVEVVGDAAGQLADGLQPLCLTKLRFEILLAGAVDEKAARLQQFARLVELAGSIRQDGHNATVATAQRKLAADHPAIGAQLSKNGVPCRGIHEEGETGCGARFFGRLESQQRRQMPDCRR